MSKHKDHLKFPDGEFTTAELAAYNQQIIPFVFSKLKEAIKDGIVIKIGTRPQIGRGKPSNLYKIVNTGEKNLTNNESIPESTVEGTLKAAEIIINNITPLPLAQEIEERCPICKHKLFTFTTPTGVTVRCNQTIEICKTPENPFGFGRNIKEAYEILVEKWTRK